MRRGLAFYCASPHYHHVARVSGLIEQVERVKQAWDSGDLATASDLVTDEMVDKFSLTGSTQACRAKLRRMLDVGVYPIIYPLPRRDRVVEDHFAAIRLAAEYAA